jgi:hypothetical protein
MHDIIIIDDVVDKTTQDLIENSIFSKDTNWTFGRTVFYGNHPEVTSTQKNKLMSFTRALYDDETEKADPSLSLYMKPLEGRINKLFSSRIQLQLPLLTEKDKVYGAPHLDGQRVAPYKVAVYYVNDTDGDTVLFKQTRNNCTLKEITDGKLDIDQTVSPKKGRLVIFDGSIYHAIGKPKTDLRCIINYNFI